MVFDNINHSREEYLDILLKDTKIHKILDERGYKKELDKSESLFIEAKNAYGRVDDTIIEFIDQFVDNYAIMSEQKKKLKDIFFWFIMIGFTIITLTPFILLIILLLTSVEDVYIIFGTILASVAEVLTSIIVLPKIVAEYLFNKKEEKANIKIVGLMQQYSEKMHGYAENHK
ncbi:MAG: hypothetical protein IKB01_08450 [Lachnospiraceae bacterium]|nr:hypothetical protein [Lachnospiraceae bacterium]